MTLRILAVAALLGAWFPAAPARAAESAGSSAAERNLIPNGTLETPAASGKAPAGFELEGDVVYGPLGSQTEHAGRGVRLLSGRDTKHDGRRAGALTTTVGQLSPDLGRWFRLRVEGLAQEGFAVERDELFLDVEFFRDAGRNSLDSNSSLDHAKRWIYPQVVLERAALADAGTNRNLGPATWRSYDLEFRTPFPEVDTLRLTVGFDRGHGRGANSEFWIGAVELTPIPVPADYQPPAGGKISRSAADAATLVRLGGRWYYDPPAGNRQPPEQFDAANAHRLFYLADRLEAPFADNVSAWLRAGWLDRSGQPVSADRFVRDNVVVSFTPTHLVVHTHGLPNHPTATFPDRWRAIDGNPNYIQEKDSTYQIPLEPRVNPRHVAMKDSNNNDHALPMGPIGIAVNGVVFFNPFDHLQNQDAVWRLDRCCGHPAPNSLYHYHKYPACVKSPWSDDGTAHSPLIGFAFDGFPVYGPYEAAGQLAKDSRENPLNEFNGHEDAARGWHYHVTPGKFPHIIGGFWGEVDERLLRRGPPGGRPGRGPGGPGMGPPGFGPPGFGPPPRP